MAETDFSVLSLKGLSKPATRHAAQHMRQIYHVLEEAQVLPPGGLEPAVFEGLPPPREMW